MRLHNPATTWGPYEEGRHVGVFVVQPGKPQTFRVLADACTIIVTHYLDDIPPKGRSVACHADPSSCVGCKRHLKGRHTPYLAVWWDHVQRHMLLLLTRDAVRECPDLQPYRGVPLRGRHITVQRVGRSTYSQLSATLSAFDPASAAWPIGCDEIAVLSRLYGIEQAGLVLVDEAA